MSDKKFIYECVYHRSSGLGNPSAKEYYVAKDYIEAVQLAISVSDEWALLSITRIGMVQNEA